MKPPTPEKSVKRRRIARYRLGSGQVRPYLTIEELEEVDTRGKEWRINEARQESDYR